jgi:hypothetical protein
MFVGSNVSEDSNLLAPKRAIFVAGVFLTAARCLRAVDACESPYGSGETGEAVAFTGVPKRAWFSGLKRVGVGVAEFSTRSVSAGRRLTVARR